MNDKQAFMAKPKYKTLTKKEKENRWRDSQAARAVRGRGPTTRIRPTSGKQLSAAALVSHTFAPCAVHYLQALEHPFALHETPCIPDLHVLPSKKIRCLTRGVFQTGVAGEGYLLANPWCNSNNEASVIGSNSAFNLTTVQAIAAPNTYATPQPKLPYGAVSFANNGSGSLHARTVGVGLRMRYIGTTLGMAGQVIAARRDENDTFIGDSSDAFRNLEHTKIFPVSKVWSYVYYRPAKPNEYEYSGNSCSTDSSLAPGSVDYGMGFWVSGTQTSAGVLGAAPFEWELIRFVEYIGEIDSKTKSHADIQAVSHIRNNLGNSSATQTPVKRLHKHITNIAKDIVEYAAPGALGGALAYSKFATPAVEATESTGLLASLEGAVSSGISSIGAMATEYLPEGLVTAGEALLPFLL